MSIKTWTGYSGVCDWPGCGIDVMGGTDYSAWGERDAVEETMVDWDWWIGADGEHHYCDKHPTVWAADIEDVAEMPRPFLLIHDGDTDDPDDDGKVTLVSLDSKQATAGGTASLAEVTC